MIRRRPGRTAPCGYPVYPAGPPHRRARPVHSRPVAGPAPSPAGRRPRRARFRTSGSPAIRTRVPHPIKARNRGRCPGFRTRAADLRPRHSPACRTCRAACPAACHRKCPRSPVIRNRRRGPRRRPGRDQTVWPNNLPDRRARNKTWTPGNGTASNPGWQVCDRRAGSRPEHRPPPMRPADTTVKDVRSA